MKPIAWNGKLWKQSVERFHEFVTPLVVGLGRSERRVAATRYIEGLLLPGQRKSIVPMAERLGVDSQSLQQFVTDSPWSDEAVWRAIRQETIVCFSPDGRLYAVVAGDNWQVREPATGGLKARPA